MSIYVLIQSLVVKAIHEGLIAKQDEVYARNQIMQYFMLDSFPEEVPTDMSMETTDLLDDLLEYAVTDDIVGDTLDEQEIFICNLMNVFISKPSEMNKIFWEKFQKSPENATRFFYSLSKSSNYIQMKQVAKNISYQVDTDFGEIDITINLSKPEKDPKQIAAELKNKKSEVNYPKCLLCIENEGYVGRIGHPARSSHRLIRYSLNNEEWMLQYSPYVYYNEHCILLSSEHRDMKISRATAERLLSFVEKTPHYFMGSNADLPIVGGSILTHDHYQGGRYEFALMKADDEYSFSMENYSNVKASVVKWPMSVIRLKSVDKCELTDAYEEILEKWKMYSDEVADIIAFSGGTPHNTITPIARKVGDEFILDLVLRNNRTSDEHPLGIFHPHEDVHHIKKENIGLIEVMGLAVLPSRLHKELEEVEKYLLDQENEIQDYHKPWGDTLKEKYTSKISSVNVKRVVRDELGQRFLKVLVDAGVYKRDAEGLEAFKRFTVTL